MKRIIVAGGGAAGFMSAYHAKWPDTEVTILEAQEKPGKKLLTTGNGKCNLTYASKKPVISYRGNGQDFTEAALKTFDQERTVQFFEELGMQKIADHCVRIMEDYRKRIGKQKESDCR